MQNKNIDLYYFSGTGNTLLACEVFAKSVAKNGYTVNFMRMEQADPSKINPDNVLGLAFPVACSMSYPFVMEFIKALPYVEGTPAFMIATMGGSAFGLRGKIKEILTEKGFAAMAAHLEIMPSNIFAIVSEEQSSLVREAGLDGIADFAASFTAGENDWPQEKRSAEISYFIYKIVTGTWKIKLLQKLFSNKINKDKCIKCGLCAKLCPVGNINAGEDGFPVFSTACQYCMRCVSYCPKQAIRSKFIFTGGSYKAAPMPYK